MNLNNYLLLGSFGAFAFVADNAGLAQSAAQAPERISGGHAEFTPHLQSYGSAASDGVPNQPTLPFPLPSIPGHPAISIVVKSPAFISRGSVFFPLSRHSRPAKDGDFVLLGEVVYSLQQDNLTIVFSDFRLDTNGSVFAKISVNGKETFGSETELLTGKNINSANTGARFTEEGEEDISATFAAAVNSLLNAAVLAPGEDLAALHLNADIEK
jgi:hypothetical protein